ncbi:MAG: hypothetical protein ACP5SH_17145 [Syntrophobacteraceae bacterium]
MATWPPDRLYSIVLDWMWESPAEIIPNNEQISEVLSVLEARPDSGEHSRLIDECRKYIET